MKNNFRALEINVQGRKKKSRGEEIGESEMCVIYYVINWRNVNDFNDEGNVKPVLCMYACIFVWLWYGS